MGWLRTEVQAGTHTGRLKSPPAYALAMLCHPGLAIARAIATWDHRQHGVTDPLVCISLLTNMDLLIWVHVWFEFSDHEQSCYIWLAQAYSSNALRYSTYFHLVDGLKRVAEQFTHLTARWWSEYPQQKTGGCSGKVKHQTFSEGNWTRWQMV